MLFVNKTFIWLKFERQRDKYSKDGHGRRFECEGPAAGQASLSSSFGNQSIVEFLKACLSLEEFVGT